MSADALVAWFVRIFDHEALTIVAEGLGIETAQRIVRGEATIADLFLAANALGWEFGDLLPGSFDELHGSVHDFQWRDAECTA
ncbi:hypothetical protein [Nocardia sp. NPDC020380]|uniref:hypothetical protein n=1 Tax=Nocardia sp. NPDC020380 TaxID=3364309 RepID=UPI00378ACAB4